MYDAMRYCNYDACQILERVAMSKPESHSFEISRDLTVGRPNAKWIKFGACFTVKGAIAYQLRNPDAYEKDHLGANSSNTITVTS